MLRKWALPSGHGFGRVVAGLRRAGWGFADQALSSLTNFAVGIIVARNVGAEDFGAFALAFTAYIITLNVSRAVSTQPLVIRYSATSRDAWARSTAAATGTSTMVGFVAGSLSVLFGAAAGGTLGQAFVALGLVLPGLMLQDAWRFAFFAAGRGSAAFVNDLVWALVLVPAMLVIEAGSPPSVFWPVLLWGVGAWAAALAGILQARLRPRLDGIVAWAREHRDLTPRYVGEAVVGLGAQQIIVVAVGAVVGLAGAGALRAGQLLLGPLNVLFQGIHLAAVPEGVRLRRSRPELVLPGLVAVAVGLASVVLVWGGAVWAMPEVYGRLLLGASWDGARAVIVPLTIALAASSVSTAALIGLRVLADARRSFRSVLIKSPISVGCGVLGAVIAGAAGAAWGTAVAGLIGIVIWWRSFFVSTREAAGRGESPVRSTPDLAVGERGNDMG